MNLFKSYNNDFPVAHEYFFYKKIQIPSIIISTILGGLG